MVSAIDPTLPADGVPAVKADLRANLSAAKTEIEALQDGKADLDHSHELDDLTDVAAPSPGNGDFLRFNGTNWAPSASSGTGGAAGDVDYRPLGTGANVRSVESYLRENAVLATDFGVVDDPNVDSRAALQRAFDAIRSGQTRSKVLILPKEMLLRSANPDEPWRYRNTTLLRDTDGVTILGAPTTIWTDQDRDGLSVIKVQNCSNFSIKDVGVRAKSSVARSSSNTGSQPACLVRVQGPGASILLENCWARDVMQLAMFHSGGNRESDARWDGPQSGRASINPLRHVTLVNCKALNTEHAIHTAGVDDIDIGNFYAHGMRSSGGAGVQRALWCGSYLRNLRGHLHLRECQPGTTAGVANFSTDMFNNVDIDGIDLSLDARDIGAFNGIRFRLIRLQDPSSLPSGASLTSRIANVTIRGVISGCSRPVNFDFDFALSSSYANESGFNAPIVENMNFENLTLVSSRRAGRQAAFALDVERYADNVGARIRDFRFSNCRFRTEGGGYSEAAFLHRVDGEILVSDCAFESERSDTEGVMRIENPRSGARLLVERSRFSNPSSSNGGVQVVNGNGMEVVLDTVHIDTPRGYNSSPGLPNSSNVNVYRIGLGKDRSRVYANSAW